MIRLLEDLPFDCVGKFVANLHPSLEYLLLYFSCVRLDSLSSGSLSVLNEEISFYLYFLK